MSIANSDEGRDHAATGGPTISRRGRRRLWDPLRDDSDYRVLKIMLELAEEKPIKPYALARAALHDFRRKVSTIQYVCDEVGEWDLTTVLRWVKAGRELEEASSNGSPASPMIDASSRRSDEVNLLLEQHNKKMLEKGREWIEQRIIFFPQYRYGDDLIHIKRLGDKFKDLLEEAKYGLFVRNFAKDEQTNENFSRYCPTEEIRQEALRIIDRLSKGSGEVAHQSYLTTLAELSALDNDPLRLPD